MIPLVLFFALAFVGMLLPAQASMDCLTAPEIIASVRPDLPAGGVVGEVPTGSVPTVLAWLEAVGLRHEADTIVQVSGDRGLALILVRARSCEDRPLIVLTGAPAAELVALVTRFRALKGWGPELGA